MCKYKYINNNGYKEYFVRKRNIYIYILKFNCGKQLLKKDLKNTDIKIIKNMVIYKGWILLLSG